MKVFIYNVQMANTLYCRNGQNVRSKVIVQKIIDQSDSFDVLALCELFHHQALVYFVKKLKVFYPYFTIHPTHSRAVVSGGLVIMSKFPISESRSIHYGNARGEERLASKGALLAILETPAGLRCIVHTHPQSWDKFEKDRIEQFKSLFKWVEHIKCPLVVVGDLNIDYHNLGDFKPYIKQLPTIVGENTYSQTKTNSMRGNDTSSNREGCGMQYYCNVCDSDKHEKGLCKLVCKKVPATEVFCPCCPEQLLDYGFIPKNHPKAKHFELQVLAWKSDRYIVFDSWMLGRFTMPKMRTLDLSDHYPVALEWEA